MPLGSNAAFVLFGPEYLQDNRNPPRVVCSIAWVLQAARESSPVKPISLNIDLGELPDEPDEFYALATMVNIACGGHAGNRESMQRAIELARKTKAKVAAHPSYPDREGFGRKSMNLPSDALEQSLREQMAELAKIARDVDVSIVAVKPHGALYHDVQSSSALANAFLLAMQDVFDVSVDVVGPPTESFQEMVKSRGRGYLREGFADRTYLPDGRLTARSQPNALLTNPDEAATQAVQLAESGRFDTLCVHGDAPNALAVARAVRRALADSQWLERG